jgi:hypothetical protein
MALEHLVQKDRMMNELTMERLKEVLEYDAETGAFVWLKNLRQRRLPDGSAGTNGARGERKIVIDQKSYLAHRLAWFYVHGVWPTKEIDHIDGNPANNRIANLRDVSRAMNAQNWRTASANNTHGVFGVTKVNRRYRAKLTVDGKSRHVGYFDTPEEANAAYIQAKRTYHPGCTI